MVVILGGGLVVTLADTETEEVMLVDLDIEVDALDTLSGLGWYNTLPAHCNPMCILFLKTSSMCS